MTQSSSHIVLFAGVRSSTVAQVAAHVPEIQAIVCEQGQEVLTRLAEQPCSLVVLEHHVQNPAALGVLSWLRLGLGLSTLPVVYCLPARSRSEMPVRLSGPLQVSRTLFHPYSTGKLARTVVELLGLPPREADLSTPMPGSARSLDGALSRLWDKSRPRAMDGVEFLENAVAALRDGQLADAARHEAEREVHKLTGLVETYGYMDAGATTRAIAARLGAGVTPRDADSLEQQLRLLRVQLEELRKSPRSEVRGGSPVEGPTTTDPADSTLVLSVAVDDQATKLRMIPKPEVPAAAPEPVVGPSPSMPVESPRLLLVDLDADMVETLRNVASVRNIRVDHVQHPDQAVTLLGQKSYAAILVDMSLRDHYDAANRLLASCHAFTPPLPALVVSAAVDFTDRVQIAQLGVRGFLQKPVSPAAVLDAFEMAVFKQNGRTSSVVLAVDDDPAMLETIRTILQPEGLTVVCESQPSRFWDTLEACMPDLVLLDIDMPGINGLDICQTLRNDVRWRLNPIVFLTTKRGSDTIRRVFAAGADDYITKPVESEELAVRITQRVRRYREVQKSVADGLTGLANHQESAAWLDRHVHRAVAQKQRFALAVVRINRLVHINEKWGRTVGDAVIARFGRFLSDSVMVTDLVSRRAGPEFIVGMPGLTRLEGVDRMQDVVESLRREQFLLPSGTLSVTCSVGVSALSVDGETVDSILQAAEKACRASLRQEGAHGHSSVVAAGQPDAPSASALDIALIDTEDELFDMLSTRSYHLRHFRHADEAVSALAGQTPEVKARIILIGSTSAPLDGVTVVRQLAGGGVLKHARVILLVPSEASVELDQVRGLGRIEPMVRPYDKAAVMRKVRRALSEQLTGKLKME